MTSPKPTICQVVLSLNPGGLERMVLDMVRGLSADGYPCLVYCLQEPGQWGEELERTGTPVRLVKKQEGIDLSLPGKLARHLRQDKVDLFHSHNKGPLLYTCLASALSGVPLVSTKHGRNDPDRWDELWLNRFSALFCKAIVAVSDDALQVVRQREHIPARKVAMIHNGVDTEHPAADPARLAALRQEFGIEPDDLVIINVARLSFEKNHALLLEAFGLLAPEMPTAKLLLVGDGQKRQALQKQAADLGLSERIIFAGMRDRVPEILQLAHVFALSSDIEGLSISILEAMAAGLPVVATDVGGNRELVTPSQNGLLAPPRAAAELSQALARVLSDQDLRLGMGQESRRRVCRDFSLRGMVRRYEELYLRLLGLVPAASGASEGRP
ncbi:MAG: glycosyltransferase [Pseudomonadota bacterium]